MSITAMRLRLMHARRSTTATLKRGQWVYQKRSIRKSGLYIGSAHRPFNPLAVISPF